MMNARRKTHRRIVGDYDGACVLGVTDNPLAFLLRVGPTDTGQFPDKVTIGGNEVPVIVRGDFQVPQPLHGVLGA
jgi:hypothetical protein